MISSPFWLNTMVIPRKINEGRMVSTGKPRSSILACKVYIRVNHTWKIKCDKLHLPMLVELELETFSKSTFMPQYSEEENKFRTSLLLLLTIHVFPEFTETQLYRDISIVWSVKNEFSALVALTPMASTTAEETAKAVMESPLLSAADVCEVSVYLNSRHATHNLEERMIAVIKTKLPLKVAMSSLRNLANEATSSAENTDTHGSSVKRKRSESNCHQCHRNDKETVVGCTECKKKYCMLCITKWYPTLDRTDVVEACPACRNICNCATSTCLKPGMANKNLPIPDIKLGPIEKTLRSMDIVEVSLPFLKQFVAEDNRERAEEARIQDRPTNYRTLPFQCQPQQQ